MTLAEAVADIQGKVSVDLDIGFDIENPDLVAKELIKAARIASRDTYFLFTLHSPIALTACDSGADAGSEIDLLTVAVSGKQIFHCYGIHINNHWLDEVQFDVFIRDHETYYSDLSSAVPQRYVPMSPSSVRIHPSPSADAAAATDNFAIGFYLHDPYTWAQNQYDELEGPYEFHDLIVDRCFLDITEGYVAGDDALKRRSIIQDRYDKKSESFKLFNESRMRKIRRRAGAGLVVRTRTVYGGTFR